MCHFRELKPSSSVAIILVLVSLLATVVQSQVYPSSFLPASEYVWGTPSAVPCYSRSINRNAFSLLPVTQTVAGTGSVAGVATAITSIRIWSDALIPFYAQIQTGGVGSTTFTLLLRSLHGGFLQANIALTC